MAGGTPKPLPRLESSMFSTPIPLLNKPSLLGFSLIGVGLSSNPIGVGSMLGQEDWSRLESSFNQSTPIRVKVGATEFRAADWATNQDVKARKAKSWYKTKMSRAKPRCVPISSHASSLCLTIWAIRPWDPGSYVGFRIITKVSSLGCRMRRSILCSTKLSVQASRRDETPARLGE